MFGNRLPHIPVLDNLAVAQPEEVKVGGQKVALLKLTAVPEEIQGVQLPSSSFWFDKNYQLIRSETQMPGLGKSPAAERIRIHPDGTIEGLF